MCCVETCLPSFFSDLLLDNFIDASASREAVHRSSPVHFPKAEMILLTHFTFPFSHLSCKLKRLTLFRYVWQGRSSVFLITLIALVCAFVIFYDILLIQEDQNCTWYSSCGLWWMYSNNNVSGLFSILLQTTLHFLCFFFF